MLDADWYAGDRATEPARIEMLSGENRLISIGLSEAVGVGEFVQNTGMTSTLRSYRQRAVSYADSLGASILYNAGTKTVAQQIDASKLPLDTPVVYEVNFNVTTAAGTTDRRAVFLIILVRV